MTVVTNNRSILLPVQGVDVVWGTLLNNGVMSQLDLILGATQAKSITSADVNLSQAEWNNCAIALSGTLTGDHALILPLNPNSATVAVGGLFVVSNQTSGAYNVTVKTAASGSTGVIVPQGVRTWLYSDGTNVYYADDAKVQITPYAGNPNGHVAGQAASVNSVPSFVWDYTNFVLYVCTTSGNAAAAVWTNSAATSAIPTPQGYLTPTSNTPIITGDVAGATAIYYTPFMGAQTVIHNGSAIIPYAFSQMQLTLTTSQAAGQIYDIFLAYNGGSPVIGTGPSWAAGSGGSVTPGSCARGSGAGSTAISRSTPTGYWVNTNSMSLIYNTGSGNNTITVAAGQGVYLGSIYINGAAGNVTCNRSYGQSRVWGIWNCYNRQPLSLSAGDSTASWSYASSTVRPSNGSSANSLSVFCGLAESITTVSFIQAATLNSVSSQQNIVGIGWNATNAFSGTVQLIGINGPTSFPARYIAPPSLGVNVVTSLESAVAGTPTFTGTETYMRLDANWMG